MTSTAKHCPQCGAGFPVGYAAPLCPACLLKLGFESRDGQASSATSPYQPRYVPPTPEELAPRFPQLEILEQIGCGGMGVVYRARQKPLDRLVALKILRPDFGGETNFAERFQREARALARLNHPHIVTVYDFGRIDDVYFFVMEYIDGANLRQLERSAQLTPGQALALVPQVCEALQYAHEQGVVHRDIKPENILITRDGRVKIADFGLAKLAGHPEQSPLTGTWQVMGTPHYMAPEQVERPTEVDHRADIYSLGVVFYEMLTGELPLGRFPAPSHKARIDVRLDDVVFRSLEKEPGRRYQQATDVRTDVEEIRQTEGQVAAEPEARDRYSGGDTVARARVLADLHVPATALVYLGVAEVVLSLGLAFFWPWLLIVTLTVAAITIWTGFSLQSLENLKTSRAGMLWCLLPASILYVVKLFLLAFAYRRVRDPRAQVVFGSVPWREGPALAQMLNSGNRCLDWGYARWDQLWQCLESLRNPRPTLRAIGRVLNHPISRTLANWILGSSLWAVYSFFLFALAGNTALHAARRISDEPFSSHGPLINCLMGIVVVGWLIGEIILSRSSLRTWQTNGSTEARDIASGPKLALMVGVIVSALLATALPWLQYLQPGGYWFDRYLNHPWLDQIYSSEVAAVYGMFAAVTGLAVVVMNWPALRWATRSLLLGALVVALGIPPLFVVGSGPHPLTIAMLLPLALCLPGVVWGWWGTRRIERLENSDSTVNPGGVSVQTQMPMATVAAFAAAPELLPTPVPIVSENDRVEAVEPESPREPKTELRTHDPQPIIDSAALDDGLVLVGLVELALSPLWWMFNLPLWLVAVAVGTTTVWTGLSLKSAENLRNSVIAGAISLTPTSVMMWPIKAALLGLAAFGLRTPESRRKFGETPWREGPAWRSMRQWLTAPAESNKVDGDSKVSRVIRAVLFCLFWSVVWLQICSAGYGFIVRSVVGGEVLPGGMLHGRLGDRWQTLAPLIMLMYRLQWLIWLAGEVVLVGNAAVQILAVLRNRVAPPRLGPRMSLWAAVLVMLILSGLLGAGPERIAVLQMLTQAGDSSIPLAVLQETAILQLIFLVSGALAAEFLRRGASRWATSGVLIAGCLVPIVYAQRLLATPGLPETAGFVALPMLLCLPALAWALVVVNWPGRSLDRGVTERGSPMVGTAHPT